MEEQFKLFPKMATHLIEFATVLLLVSATVDAVFSTLRRLLAIVTVRAALNYFLMRVIAAYTGQADQKGGRLLHGG